MTSETTDELSTPTPPENPETALPHASGWILEKTSVVATLIIFGIAVVRSGLRTEIDPAFLRLAQQLPRPGVGDYRGTTIISEWLFHLLGMSTYRQWAVLHIIIGEVFAIAMFVLVMRRFREREQRFFILVALLGSSLVVVMFNQIGWYDIWTFLAGALLVLGRRWPSALFAGVLFGCTNVEEALLGMLALGLCAFGLGHERSIAARIAWAMAALVGARLGIEAWYIAYHAHTVSRLDVFFTYASNSTRTFLAGWPIQVYAWFSASWLLVITLIWSSQRGRRIFLVLGLIVVPAVATVSTLDGTRVFVGVMLPAFLLLLRHYAETPAELATSRNHLTRITLTLMMVTPGILTFFPGVFQFPWINYR